MLPLELTFEDYNIAEKIAYLKDQRIAQKGVPNEQESYFYFDGRFSCHGLSGWLQPNGANTI